MGNKYLIYDVVACLKEGNVNEALTLVRPFKASFYLEDLHQWMAISCDGSLFDGNYRDIEKHYERFLSGLVRETKNVTDKIATLKTCKSIVDGIEFMPENIRNKSFEMHQLYLRSLNSAYAEELSEYSSSFNPNIVPLGHEDFAVLRQKYQKQLEILNELYEDHVYNETVTRGA